MSRLDGAICSTICLVPEITVNPIVDLQYLEWILLEIISQCAYIQR